MVDWRIAERTAASVGAGVGPLGSPGTEPDGYRASEVREACEGAIESAAAYTGLGPVADPPPAELVGRREWSAGALATLAAAARPVERRLEAELDLPGPLGPLARAGAGAALGAEAGLVVGYASRRVLGQYDVPLVGPPRLPRLLFVTVNLDRARRELEAGRGLFLRWVALHECTHVVQFARVGWLESHLRGLVAELITGAVEAVDAESMGSLARRLLADPRELARAALRGELARALTDPSQRATLDRLQATMCVVEGHAEHVMDAASPNLGPELDALRRRLGARRHRHWGLGRVIARLLGLELKLRQYEFGKAFCEAVVAERGAAGLRAVWDSPEALPDLAEVESPRLWLDRVAAASLPA